MKNMIPEYPLSGDGVRLARWAWVKAGVVSCFVVITACGDGGGGGGGSDTTGSLAPPSPTCDWKTVVVEEVTSCLAGSDVNALDDEGWAPLHLAAAYNPEPGVIAALVNAGAEVSQAEFTIKHTFAPRGKVPRLNRGLSPRCWMWAPGCAYRTKPAGLLCILRRSTRRNQALSQCWWIEAP